jgi:hypothetical protein
MTHLRHLKRPRYLIVVVTILRYLPYGAKKPCVELRVRWEDHVGRLQVRLQYISV